MTRQRIYGKPGHKFGKLMDTETLAIEGQEVKVEIRAKKRYGGGYDFTAVHVYGSEGGKLDIEVLGPRDDSSGMVQEMKDILCESLAVEWERFILIQVFGDESRDGVNYHGTGNMIVTGRELKVLIGVFDKAEVNDQSLYRRVSADRDWETKEWEFTHAHHVGTNGPTAGEETNYGCDYQTGIVPFDLGTWNQLLQLVDAMEELEKKIQGAITGEDPEHILHHLQRLPGITGG